jgi:hypothetical protein
MLGAVQRYRRHNPSRLPDMFSVYSCMGLLELYGGEEVNMLTVIPTVAISAYPRLRAP